MSAASNGRGTRSDNVMVIIACALCEKYVDVVFNQIDVSSAEKRGVTSCHIYAIYLSSPLRVSVFVVHQKCSVNVTSIKIYINVCLSRRKK